MRTGIVGASARNSVAVRAGEVRDRPHDPLTPEELVREGRDVAHVDPGADDRATLADVAQRGRNELAGGREDDHRVELLGRARERVAGPHGSERARERLRLFVPCARPGEHPATLADRDLADDVGGRAEAVQPDPLRVAGEPQRAVADEPGAEERRRLLVGVAVRDREAVALVRDRELGVAAVEVVAGEAGAVAEVLAAGQAEATLAARPARARARRPALRRSKRSPPTDDLADDLMTRDERELRLASSSPSTMCRSVRHTPHARTRSSTWPASGSRIGKLRARSGVRGASSTIARMAGP